jgi:hypothetical protein
MYANGLNFVMVVFTMLSTIVTAIVPRGDYTKARRALRQSLAR